MNSDPRLKILKSEGGLLVRIMIDEKAVWTGSIYEWSRALANIGTFPSLELVKSEPVPA